jgi:hypothetical protein
MSLELLKSLGVDTKGLRSYKELYGTNPLTYGYKGSSMWAYTISSIDGTVEVNRTYFKESEEMKEYNFLMSKKHLQGVLDNLNLPKLNKFERESWNSIIDKYNLTVKL